MSTNTPSSTNQRTNTQTLLHTKTPRTTIFYHLQPPFHLNRTNPIFGSSFSYYAQAKPSPYPDQIGRGFGAIFPPFSYFADVYLHRGGGTGIHKTHPWTGTMDTFIRRGFRSVRFDFMEAIHGSDLRISAQKSYTKAFSGLRNKRRLVFGTFVPTVVPDRAICVLTRCFR